jgi:hypothetical protein
MVPVAANPFQFCAYSLSLCLKCTTELMLKLLKPLIDEKRSPWKPAECWSSRVIICLVKSPFHLPFKLEIKEGKRLVRLIDSQPLRRKNKVNLASSVWLDVIKTFESSCGIQWSISRFKLLSLSWLYLLLGWCFCTHLLLFHGAIIFLWLKILMHNNSPSSHVCWLTSWVMSAFSSS